MRQHPFRLISAAAAIAILLSGCFPTKTDDPAGATPTHEARADAASGGGTDLQTQQPSDQPEVGAASALATLEQLTVSDDLAGGYDRESQYGGWADLDGDGCNTRQEILRRDLVDIVLDTDGCRVMAGTLHDPYTGKTIAFTHGADTSADVQIDHVVALSQAHYTGMHAADAQTRIAFANDPLNLLAVDGPENNRKGNEDASGWLPPAPTYRCPLVARQIAVKTKYSLNVTTAEAQAMRRVLETCPNEPLPTDDGGSAASSRVAAARTPRPSAPAPEPVRQQQQQQTETFKNCAAARAAGAAPVLRGDPGYGPHLDRDGDGVGCEG